MNNIMPYPQMMNPNLYKSPMVDYPTEKLEDMYPEIYYKVFPKIQQMCVLKDTQDNNEMYPNPTRDAVERMTDDIYRDTMMEMGEQEGMETGTQRQYGIFGGPGYGYPGYIYPGYGYPGYRGSPVRDLIGILLIRELLRRRGYHY